jgi:hypothetical protein
MTICIWKKLVIVFMQGLFLEFTNNKDNGFWLCCVRLNAFVFYVGCGRGLKLMLFVRNRIGIQAPHKILILQKNYDLVRQVYDHKNEFQTSNFIPNLSTYHVIRLSSKIDKSIFTKRKKWKWIHIHLNKYIVIYLSISFCYNIFKNMPYW